MDVVNLFAQMPDTPEPIIAQVHRDLVRETATIPNARGFDLDHVAEVTVRELWESRVRTFVPILALRQAREMLGAQGSLVAETAPLAPAAKTAGSQRPERDILYIGDDVLRIEEDVIPRND